jgi:hypothetical protein
MQSAAWAELLRLIPPALRENLSLTTSTGAEIALQNIVRADRDYLVIRGRVTGTTDGIGLFIIPFDRLSHLTFQKSVSEADVRALFEGAGQSPASVPSTDNSTPGENGKPHSPDSISNSPAEPNGGRHPSQSNSAESNDLKSSAVDKAALLERLRNRRPVTPPPVKPILPSQTF